MRVWMKENAPTLPFDAPPLMPKRTTTPLAKRYEAMTAAERAADEAWRREYPKFILRFLENNGSATAEQIRLAYLGDRHNPTTKNEKASGGIFARLKRVGLIVDIGFERSVKFGNYVTLYRRTELERES